MRKPGLRLRKNDALSSQGIANTSGGVGRSYNFRVAQSVDVVEVEDDAEFRGKLFELRATALMRLDPAATMSFANDICAT